MSDRPTQSFAVRVNPSKDGLLLVRGVDVYELDSIAAEIWRQCDGLQTVDDIVAAITQQYQVDHDEARKDVLEFIEDLGRARLLE